jgi:hypothetical protein
VVIAAEGPNNSLDFYWQQNGATGWNPETVAGARSTYSAPSLAVNGGGVNIVAQGPGDCLNFWWAFNGSSTWTWESVATFGTTYSAPAIVSNDGSANVVAEGPGNSLDFYWQQNGTTPWHPEVVAADGTTYSAPAITANDGSVNIVAQGPQLDPQFYWAQNGTANWHPGTLPGSDITSSAITTYTGNRDGVHVVSESLFGTLSVDSAENGSGTWQYQAAYGDGGAGAAPAATMNNGSLNIAVFASSGDLDFYWQDSSGAYHQELVSPASLN